MMRLGVKKCAAATTKNLAASFSRAFSSSSSHGGRRDEATTVPIAWRREDLPEDCVAAGLKVMRVERWPRLPKGRGVEDIQKVRDDFLEREQAVPGPYTVVVEGPKMYKARPAPPRDLEQLREYLKTPQYVFPDDDPFINERLADAWEVLGQNPRVLESQKEEFMQAHQQNLRELQAMDIDVEALFKIPPLTAEQIEQQAKEKKAALEREKKKKKRKFHPGDQRRFNND